ncbi:hypothetical protein LAZ67_2003462 [Cordylochernes scorpioides]|uniref:Integrase catalytic domain-containing protein n=1 Tax=Cordylochernes scorpioides TaxID=51811 RepID=A0ABY6K340_9ARAC|nr:hypothetical protein LAZ67_2003462 [Cordylochernes scorpioides]
MTTELPQIQKFNGDNFHLWKFQMKIILEAKDLLSITDGSKVKPEIEDIAKFSEWKKKDAKSKMLITTALEKEEQKGQQPSSSARDDSCAFSAETSAFLAETKDSWIADSGATDHMTFRREWFSTFEEIPEGVHPVCLGDGKKIYAKAKQSSQTHVAQLSLDIWHQRMGHVNPIKLTQMFENNVFEVNIKIREKPDSLLCEAYIYGKQNRKVFHASTSPNSTYPGELIYSDVCGPMSKRSPGGSLYFVSFKDDFSRFRVAYFIRHKSDVLEKFKEFVKRVRTETGNKIKRFRTDNGTEFLNKIFSDYLKSLGIVHELTAPYTPEQNGISERDNRTIVESAKYLLHGRKMPLELWAEAVNTVVYLLNRCTTKVLGNSTPHEIWYKRKPSILHLKTFGCNAYVHIPKDNRKKLDKKKKSCRYPLRNRIREKEQSSTNCTRAISYACYVYDQEPLNYEDANVGQNSKKWKLAMDDEFNSLMKNQTWTYVTLPSDRKAIACKWVHKIKQNADGSNKMFKSRLVAKSYSQKSGLDYGETFSPVVKFDSIRTILSLCALLDMEMIQLDVKSAFLNGDLEEELYMEQPQGYENPDFPNHDNQEIEEMNKIPYRQTIGSLMYLMTGTRPDIAYAVSRVSQFMNNPGPSHWTAVKKIFVYLKATKNIGICFGGSSCTTYLIGFSDADFAGDLDTRKSTTGYVFMLNNGPISWCSQKQNCVSLSTTESEYIAASKATKEAIWLRQLLRELHQEQVKPTTIFCDDQICIRLVHNPEYHKRTKHIDISYHFIRDHFQKHAIDLLYVCANDQAADIFTKALPPEKYRRSQLGLFETTRCSSEFNTYANQFDEICQQRNLRRLKLYHTNIAELFKTIKETYYQIVRSNALEASETLFKEYIDVKNRYETFVFEIEEILEVENVSQPVKLEQSAISNVKLPKFNLPVFSGEMSQWLSFKDLFLVTIDKNTTLSDIQKLQYLHSSLKGDAARIIKGFPITENNYNQAWKTLIERYDNKREIIFSQLDKIFKIKLYKISTSKAIYESLDICNESLRNLETIGLERNEMVDIMLIHFLQKKLDTPIRQQWELSYDNQELPSYQRFISFLAKQAQSLMNTMKDTTSKENLNKRVNTYNINVGFKKCLLCKLRHKLNQCNEFRQMSIQNRIGYVKQNQLCSNCLRGNHSVENCKITNRCFHCNRNHHTLLHVVSSPPRQRESSSVQSTSPKSVQPSNVPSTSTSCCLSGAEGSIQILLSTAIIHKQDVNGEDQICRALLDNGSQRSLITEKCAAKLGIPIRRKRIAVGGLGDQFVESSLGEVLIRFSSHFDHQSFETTALVLTKLTNNIPSFTVKKINYSHMKGLILADPSYFKSREIDVILGSDIVFNLIQEGRRNGNENEPSAIHSKLGWLVYGPTSVSERQSFRNMAHFSSELESEDLIKRFWELESIPLEEIPTKEEKDCESHYLKNVVRDESGRYIVRLPFKESAERLGQSKSIAISRFLNLEKRLEQNESIYAQYKQFMNEYIRLGHMQASCSLQTEPKYYIPHHCILKAQPTTLRVVFDASTKTTTQISLNDLLHVGPKLQNNIFNILLKFRKNSVALVADIEKMYRQIRLHPDDIKYQTILWRDRKDLELQEYNLLTVTYGLACAPYLAIRTLHQIDHEVQVSNPRISKIIREDFYVDDLLTGCPTVEDAKGLMQQLIAVLGSGGFVLRKWVSNETSIIEDLPLLLRGKGEVMEFNRKESGVNVLGIQWDPSYDTLNISCKSGPADIKSKRQIVSAIARIYDPCGWLSPTTVVLKLLLQELWKLKIGWDEDIPASIQRKWNTFEREMKHFQQVSIPRCIFKRNLLISNMQMHGFCDSSELAYSAVCYLRITYENNQIETILLTAKTKVAPIKKITIPRLELCAALMLAQLQSQTTQALPFNIDEQFYWTDSKIVLAWITSESKKWQIFVANRVAKIQDLTAAHSWQYISGKQNPADLATRGILPSCLINSKLWWHGPVWLTLDGSENIPSFTIDPSMGLEERSVILHATIAEPCPEFLSKYSSFTKLLRVMAWCKRFINITRKQPIQRLSFLTSQDLKDSLLQIVKIIQRCEFTPEINACIKNIPLPRKSRLISLNIFINSQGILRVGGRLRHSDLDIDQKHPMLIPKDHFVTKLIVLHYHLNNLHSGTQLTLSLIRNKFWIPSGRNLIKRVLNQCLVCLKGRPFEKIGIDLAGPIQAKPMLKRSKVIFKFYIVLFVCFTTKAIHLEISSDLTAETFLAALKRFISRRGRPTDIYSDNATNFKGASNILKERWKLFKAANIQDFSAIESINWHFIPPSAPNFGGLWEAGIKSVKTILSKTMKSRLLNYEELLTLLAQIEACLNSRPLTFVSNDPNDLTALTPGHFLIGNAMRHDAESDHSTLNLRSRWDLIQPQRDYFWNRWSCEYLHQLQERRKWRTSHPDVNIGDLVMLKEQNKPLQWKLARIVQIFPGEDDHVRVVLLRTPKGLLKRPITKICPLPYKE